MASAIIRCNSANPEPCVSFAYGQRTPQLKQWVIEHRPEFRSILPHPAQKIESLKVSIDYDSHLEQASVIGLSGAYLTIGEDFLLVPG